MQWRKVQRKFFLPEGFANIPIYQARALLGIITRHLFLVVKTAHSKITIHIYWTRYAYIPLFK